MQAIRAGETQAFSVDVAAGEFIQVTLDGRGTLLRLTITSREGETLATRERRAGLRTPIMWAAVADRSTTLVFAVTSLEQPGPERRFAIALDVRRASDTAAVARATAGRAIEQAERFEREGQLENALARYEEALARWRESADRRREAETLIDRGRLLADLARPKEAADAFSNAAAICQSSGDRACESAAVHRLGRLYANTGQPPQAFDTLQKALALREALGDEAAQAETLMELGGLDATRSENERAQSFFTRSLALARSSGDRRTEADVLNMRAVLLGGLGEPDQARELYESALSIRRAIQDAPGEGQTTSNLGVIYRGLGEPRRAIASYEQALIIRRRLGAAQSIANTLHNLGVAHADLGEHERALELFREALDLMRKSGGRRGEAFALQAIGQSYARLGDPTRALEHYELCAPVWKLVGDKRGEAQTLLAAASVRFAAGEHARALQNYDTALALAREGGYKREVGLALVGRAAVRRQQKDLEAALSDAREAQALLAGIGELREEGRAFSAIGDVLFDAERTEEAVTAFREALTIFEAVEDRAEQANVHSRLGRASERAGRLTEARYHALAALDIVESARASLTAEGLSVSLFASKRPLYTSAIGLLMRLHEIDRSGGHDVQAFAVAERMRARSLLDLLSSGEMRAGDEDKGVLADIQRLQELINSKAARLTRLLAAPATRKSPLVPSARREIDDLLARLDALQADARRNGSGSAVAQATPLTLQQAQSELLDRDTVMLSFAVGEQQSFGWAVTDSAYRAFSLRSRSELERLSKRLLDAVTEASTSPTLVATESPEGRLQRAQTAFTESIGPLSTALLGPAAALLTGRSRVLVVADGVLQSLPFAALSTPARDGARLGLTHEIVVLPSASVGGALIRRASNRAPASPRVAVFADPVFSPEDLRVAAGKRTTPDPLAAWLPRLRFSRAEADAIAALAPRSTRVWTDFAATRSAALDHSLESYGVIHLAAHAIVDEERPQLSGIVLSQVDAQGRLQNGVVRLHEVYNLSLNARLVVLSACRTALGQRVEGEGLIGLARGFLHAGANSVVATLWAVDDRATSKFMSRFYDALLKRRLSPSSAMRAARQEMQADRRWSHPMDWGAFVVIGVSH
jgi:CHAT domain-containing protein/tetratricopeptide (TPR) repeat protein